MAELLCPAGNFDKLKAAVLYGADAVYLAGSRFGMRAAADNFSIDEIYEAVRLAHAGNVKIYITINTMPHTAEYPALREYLDSLRGSGIDAVIAADLGVISAVKELLPETEIHVSTQASIVSAAAAEAYLRMGCRRVVLARELSLSDIRALRKEASRELELECFVHGSMCIAWSGRCLLSSYLTGRDGNRGACAQPCRWSYKAAYVEEANRPGIYLPVEQDESGSFVMASKDLCMIEHIPELYEAGIDSFKIEGRMKSVCYTAVTANVYRMAMNEYEKSPSGWRFNPEWLRELGSVSHREFSTGFFYDNPSENAQTVTDLGYIKDKAYAGIVEKYDGDTGRAVIMQMNKISEGDTVEIMSPGRLGRPFKAENMRNEKDEPITSAPHPQMRYSLSVPFEVHEGDILRA